MNRLIKIGSTLPNLRSFGSLLVRSEWIKKIPGNARTNMTKTSQTMESRFRDRDLIPNSFSIVYRGAMDYYIHLAHHSATIMFFIGVGTAYNTFYVQDEPIQFPVEITKFKMIGLANYTQVFIMYATYFIMIAGMRQVSSKYVFRMYYNPTTNTYRAIKVGFLPMATRSYDFQAGTLIRQTKKHIVPWLNGLYKTPDTKILLFEGGFRTSADFQKLFKN